MTEAMPPWLRENLPVFGVAAILLLAFAALTLFGGPPLEPAQRAAGERVRMGPDHADLGTLPATAESNRVIVSQLAPGAAQLRNAGIAFAAGGPGKARPFSFSGSAADRARARECLALAGIAEAGAGEADQRAVMQVVLNRVRHPAFAKTVCGVVFEGSERATGCQFSFTCDGSLARRYPETLWETARRRADEALGGRVEAGVGNATHFHADYVYPWWSPRLDKIAQVGSHLFFRWRGFWGTPQALSARYRGGEPDPLALRGIAQAVERPEELTRTLLLTGEAVRTITAPPPSDASQSANFPAPSDSPGAPGSAPSPGVHFVLVGAQDAPAALVDKARVLCPGTRYCQVYGWASVAEMPARLPLSDEARGALKFSFLPGRGGQGEAIYFDCRTYANPAVGACLPRARR